MNHTEALRLQAAEKYLLNEFTPAQRDEYEEHYFDCHECAEDLKATAVFLESVRQLLRGILEPEPQMARQLARTAAPARTNRGFFAWLRPAFIIPSFAALLIFIGYQNGVTIPRLESSSRSGEVLSAAFHLTGIVRGGTDAAAPKLQVKARESFVLGFDFTPVRAFSTYRWQLQDKAGKLVVQGTLSGDMTNQAVNLLVNGGVEDAGDYNLVFFGGDNSAQTSEVQRFTFAVAFQR